MAEQTEKKTEKGFTFVRFNGTKHLKHYHGFDGKASIDFEPGDVQKVTDAKAEQLFADFGEAFESASESDYTKSLAVQKDRAEKNAAELAKGRKRGK